MKQSYYFPNTYCSITTEASFPLSSLANGAAPMLVCATRVGRVSIAQRTDKCLLFREQRDNSNQALIERNSLSFLLLCIPSCSVDGKQQTPVHLSRSRDSAIACSSSTIASRSTQSTAIAWNAPVNTTVSTMRPRTPQEGERPNRRRSSSSSRFRASTSALPRPQTSLRDSRVRCDSRERAYSLKNCD